MGKSSKKTSPRVPKILRVPKTIRLGSDFSGLDTGHFAMKGLGARFENKFTSDLLKEARLFQAKITKPEKMFSNMLARKPDEEIEVDVYLWTPPCQDLSAAGTGAGFGGGQQTGKLVARSLKFIKRRRPRLAVMEEVPRILSKKYRAKLLGIVKTLKNAGYKVYFKTVNAKDCKVSQNRIRFFLVSIRADSLRHKFEWPKPCKPVPATSILEPFNPKTDKVGRLPSNKRGKSLVKAACKSVLKKTRKDARKIPVLVDVDCTPKFATWGINQAQTITRQRGGTGGPWVTSRGRKLTTEELLKFQGFDPALVPWKEIGVSKRQIGQMIGNSVCPPVLGMVLSKAMLAAGLTSKELAWKP